MSRFCEKPARKEQAAKPAAESKACRPQPRLWLKANASPEECAKFQKPAHAADLALANYVRKRLDCP